MWTKVDYVATGSREELEDLRAKLCATEVYEEELNGDIGMCDYDGSPCSLLDNEHFFKEFGINERFGEMGVYWLSDCPYISSLDDGNGRYAISEWKDGLYCFRFQFGHNGEENPLLRETIENFYKIVKIFYLDGYHNTNDTNLEFFADKFPTLIDGLHYMLYDDHTADLNCDELWRDEIMTIPEVVEHDGEEYHVTGIVDFMHHSDNYGNGYGMGTRPDNLRELVIPLHIRGVGHMACADIPSLRKVTIPDGCWISCYAFMDCGIEELTLGEDVCLDMGCFCGTRVKDVKIPASTKWIEYGDFGWAGSMVHSVEEEPGTIIDGVFYLTPMSYISNLEECRRGECSARYFCGRLSSLFEKDSLVKPEDVFPEMSDEDLEWLRKEEDNYAVRNVVIYGMLHGYFTRDDHYMAKLFFLRNVPPAIMHDNDISLSLPEFEELETELNAKVVFSEEEKSEMLADLEKARLEREKASAECDDEDLPF